MVLHTFHEFYNWQEKGSIVHVPQSSFCKPPTSLRNADFVSVDAVLIPVFQIAFNTLSQKIILAVLEKSDFAKICTQILLSMIKETH